MVLADSCNKQADSFLSVVQFLSASKLSTTMQINVTSFEVLTPVEYEMNLKEDCLKISYMLRYCVRQCSTEM